MKKLLAISVLAIMLILITVTGVNATTNSTLADELYAIGKEYGMTTNNKKQVENYLSDYPVSDDEANAVISKAKEAADILDGAGVTDVLKQSEKLTEAQISQLRTLATSAAAEIGAELKFTATAEGLRVGIVKDGVTIDSISFSKTAPNTGSNLNVFLVVSAVASIALVSVFVTRKNLANA